MVEITSGSRDQNVPEAESHPDVHKALVLGMREAAERDLAGASLAIQKAQELRESAMEKLAMAEELARMWAEKYGMADASDEW